MANSISPRVRNRYQALWDYSNGNANTETIPVQLQIARSNRCNFKCAYCSNHRIGNTIPRTSLEGQTWEDLERLVPRCGMVSFHGISEFFIDPDFFRLVELAGRHEVVLALNTNGSVCTPKYVDCLRAYPARLQINFSVDAATPETFKRIRAWDFERVLRNIKTYMQAFSEREHSTWVTLSYVILKSNVHEVVPFVRLAAELGADSAKFFRLHEYGGLNWVVDTPDGTPFDYKAEYVSHIPAEYNQQVREARKVAEELGVHITIPAEIPVAKEAAR